ncbi:autotransporter outer membrane beta-barrel domain-containing protein [Pseudomonas sp. Ma2-10]
MNLERRALVQADELTLSTRGDFSYAINVLDNSVLNLTNSTLQTSGDTAHGIYLLGANITQRAVANVSDVTVQTSGDNAIGVNVNRNATATLDDVQITTTGANAFGIWVPHADSELIARNVNIDTQGNGAIGVFTQLGGNATLDGGHIHTVGSNAYALYAGNVSSIDAQNLSLQIGANSVGAYANDNSHITLGNIDLSSSETAMGLVASAGSTIDASNSTVSLTGDGARGLQGNNGGTLRLNNVGVSADGANSIGLQSQATVGVSNTFVLNNSAISAAAGRGISVQGGSTNIDLSDSQISAQKLLVVEQRQLTDGSFVDTQDVQITARRSQLTGDIQVAALNSGLQLQDHSSLIGTVHGLDNLTLDQSQWQLTGDSQIGQLNIAGGEVKFSGSPFSTLTIDGNLSGNGSFLMNSDLASLQGNLLRVGGQIEGNHTLVVEDSGHEPAAAGGELRLVDGNGGAGQFGLYGEHVDAGAFRYTLQQQGDDWFLVNSSGLPINPVDPGKPDPELLSKGANAAIASQTAVATLWNSQMSTLVKRLGELRIGQDDGGVWTRAIGSRFNISENASRAFTQNNTGMEIGADKAIPLANGKVYVGGMVGTARSDLSFGEGASGVIDSKMVGAYATYLNDNGIYVDTVLKYSHFDTDIKAPTNLGHAVKGSYGSHGIGMDVEVGKHIALKDGWFVEPQLELTATRTQGDQYTASNGLQVDSLRVDSLQSRVGSLFGRGIELESGLKVQPYVKASYINEHAGDSHVKVNGNNFKTELPGDRVELGFGGILQVSDKSKISMDAEYAKGNDIEQPWGVTLGYRYLW